MEKKRSTRPGTATDEPVPSIHFQTQAEADAWQAGIAEGMRRARGGVEAAAVPDFDPVPLRYRRDGWTPDRQVGFIRALAESGCVAEACRRLGLSAESAYELARRPDAQSFRIAWDIAMDNAVRRVGDGAFSRAINGTEIPHFYKGELVGTHRRYDERLTMFILRTRDPDRFGRRAETAERIHTREGRALDLADFLHLVKKDAEKEAKGHLRNVWPELGAPANDDEDGENRHHGRDMRHIYAYAPRADHDDGDHDDEEQGADAGGEDLTEVEADAVWAATEAHLRAVLGADPDDDEPVPPLQHYIAKALAKVRADATNVIPAKAGISAGEEHQRPCHAPLRRPPSAPQPSGPEIPASARMTAPDEPPSPPDVPRTSSTSARTPSSPRNRHSRPTPPPAPPSEEPPLHSRFRGNDGAPLPALREPPGLARPGASL